MPRKKITTGTPVEPSPIEHDAPRPKPKAPEKGPVEEPAHHQNGRSTDEGMPEAPPVPKKLRKGKK